MHLTDHISDVQLNEYLDHEANDRAQVELHLSICENCSARLTALKDLFSEIESLPELEYSQGFSEASLWETARFVSSRNPSTPLPRSLTLAVTLQAALAVIAIIVAAPFVMQFLSPYVAGIPAASFADVFLQLQSQWAAWLAMLSTFQLPRIPEFPRIELSSLFMIFTVIGISLLWLIGNGLLLRNQMK